MVYADSCIRIFTETLCSVGYFEQELTLHADQEDNVVFKLVKDQSKIPADVTAGHDNLNSMVGYNSDEDLVC